MPSITFWTDSNMAQFWENNKMLLETIQPGIMLVTAISLLGLLIGVIVRAVKKSDDEDDDDHRDYEVRHY